jgi:hypothetical protein
MATNVTVLQERHVSAVRSSVLSLSCCMCEDAEDTVPRPLQFRR